MKLVYVKNEKRYDVISDNEFDVNIHDELPNTVENWYLYGKGKKDYMVIRQAMKDIVADVGFADLKSKGKEYVTEYCAADANSIVGYLMSKGMTQEDAIQQYKHNRAVDIRKAGEAATSRIESPAFTYAVIKYLSEEDGQTFLDAIRNFVIDYKNVALTGTNYGQNIDGIMDYIESTGSYTEGGLKNYTILSPYTLEEFISELKNIIVYGNY